MTTLVLDTLDYAVKLKASGFTEQQAEGQARALADALAVHTATKAEVEAHENNLRRDIEGVRVELKRDIAETNARIELLRMETKRDIAEVNARIAETKAELTRWIIGAGLLQTTVIVAVLMKVAKLI